MNNLNDVRDKQEDGTLYHSLEAGTAIDAYVTAYKQAEKDLALTWEDIKEIDELLAVIQTDGEYLTDREVYQEVLRRYNENK